MLKKMIEKWLFYWFGSMRGKKNETSETMQVSKTFGQQVLPPETDSRMAKTTHLMVDLEQ